MFRRLIRDVYRRLQQEPFYKEIRYLYELNDGFIQKIELSLSDYQNLHMTIYYQSRQLDWDSSEDSDFERENKVVSIDLELLSEKMLEKNIISRVEIEQIRFKKEMQKYLYYLLQLFILFSYLRMIFFHFSFYQCLIIPLFHFSCESLILYVL